MNRINYKDGLDIYLEDLNFESDGTQDAIKWLFRSLTAETSTGSGIIRGFNLEINSIDNTKVDIYHSNGYGIGEAWSNNFDYIETSTGVSNIPMTTYVASSINVIAIKLLEVDINNRINGVTGQNNPTRISRSWQYQVFTSTGWIGQNLNGWVEIGRVQANGVSMPLSNLDFSNVNYWSAILNNNYITEAMLSPTFRLYQTITRQSQIYDDTYVGTPTNLENDLNQIRKIIRDIKGTLSYLDSTPGNLAQIDFNLNGLNGDGIFKGSLQELNFISSTGALTAIIDTGEALINKRIMYKEVQTGLTFAPATFQHLQYPSLHDDVNFGSIAQPTTIALAHKNIKPGTLTVYNAYPAHSVDFSGYIDGINLIVDLVNGTITRTSTGAMNVPDDVSVYFDYWTERIDVVQVDQSGNITIKQGTDVDPIYDTLLESDADLGQLKLWAVDIKQGNTDIANCQIYDKRLFLGLKTSVTKSDSIIVLASTGQYYLNHNAGFENVTMLLIPASDSTYLGELFYDELSNDQSLISTDGLGGSSIDTCVIFNDKLFEILKNLKTNQNQTLQTENNNLGIMIDASNDDSSMTKNNNIININNINTKRYNMVKYKGTAIKGIGNSQGSSFAFFIPHNFGTLNHFTWVIPQYANGAEIYMGNMWVVKGLTEDLVFNSGNTGLNFFYVSFLI